MVAQPVVASVLLLLLPKVNMLVAELLLVPRAVVLLLGLQMQPVLVPVVLRRHRWNYLAGQQPRRVIGGG
jgi:hypothetical protein